MVWILMITSARNPPWPEDVPIVDLEAAGLPVASVVRTAKIATIDARKAQPLGSLAVVERSAVATVLLQSLPAP